MEEIGGINALTELHFAPIKVALSNSGKLLRHKSTSGLYSCRMFTKMYTLSDKASPIEMFSDVHKEIYSRLCIVASLIKAKPGEAKGH